MSASQVNVAVAVVVGMSAPTGTRYSVPQSPRSKTSTQPASSEFVEAGKLVLVTEIGLNEEILSRAS